MNLTLVLLNPDMSCLCKQCSEEANWSGPALFAIKNVNLKQQSDWLKIRNGRGFLIYSAWQGLKISLIIIAYKAVLHVIDSRALTGEKPWINKAIHALLMHGYATFNMIVPEPQICCRYEMCTARPLNEHCPWRHRWKGETK